MCAHININNKSNKTIYRSVLRTISFRPRIFEAMEIINSSYTVCTIYGNILWVTREQPGPLRWGALFGSWTSKLNYFLGTIFLRLAQRGVGQRLRNHQAPFPTWPPVSFRHVTKWFMARSTQNVNLDSSSIPLVVHVAQCIPRTIK